MAKAGRITVNLEAGTSQFVLDMEQANRKLNEFGHAGVSNVQATSAALRVLEGNMTNNLRAAERFVASIPGVGAALKAAFPVIGAIALLGVLSELGKKAGEVYDAFQKLKNAPSAINSEFGKLNEGIRTSNDELRVTNDRLENEIAKLRGTPQNGLKIALDEARVSADKLGESIERDFEGIEKVLKEQNISGIKGFFSGNASTTDIQKQFFGENGFGGFRAETAQIAAEGNEKIRQATTLKERDAAQTALNNALNAEYAKQLSYINAELAKAQALQSRRNAAPGDVVSVINGVPIRAGASPATVDQSARIAELQGLKANIGLDSDRLSLTTDNARLEGLKASLEAAKEKPEKADPFKEAIDKLSAELSGARSEGAASGSPLTEAIAKGATKATEEIARLNEELGKTKKGLTGSQQIEIQGLNGQIALAQLVTEEKKRAAQVAIEDAKRDLEQQTKAIGLLAEQVGGTSELDKREQERQNQIGKTIEKIQAETAALVYQTQAVGQGRAAQRAAEFAAINARGRSENEDPAVLAAQLAQQAARNKLDDAQRGVGLTASQGFDNFFKTFGDNTLSAGRQVETVLGGAFRGLNQQMTDLITGQKTSWSSFFRSIAADIANMGLNNLLGSLFKGISGSGGLGGLIGAIFGGFKADGGDVSSGTPYIVGERGPELFVPGGSGSIVPNNKMGGGSGDTYIDARGSENSVAVEARVRRASEAARQAGARDGARLSRELRARVPNAKAYRA